MLNSIIKNPRSNLVSLSQLVLPRIKESGSCFIFDVGNVCHEYQPRFLKTGLARFASMPLKNVMPLLKNLIEDFGDGRITPETFSQEAGKLFKNIPAEALKAYWTSACLGPKRSTLNMIQQLTENGVPTYAFSNTNPWHWDFVTNNFVPEKLFTGTFPSHKIGLRKPSVESYRHVEAKVGVDPRKIYFVDDLVPNIEAANKSGWNGILFTNARDLKKSIEEIFLPR